MREWRNQPCKITRLLTQSCSVVVSIFLLATIAFAAPPETVVRPKAGVGPLDNPLKGWCPFADAGDITLPYSMVFFNVSWSELEPVEGQFAFEEWEKRVWDTELAKGRHVVFRLYIDSPKHRSGFPTWLRDKGVRLTRYTNYGGGESPDYDDPRVVEAMERLVTALTSACGLCATGAARVLG